MRKLFVSLAVLVGFAAGAATTISTVTFTVAHQQKEYKKIKVSEVSKDAMDRIKKSYGAYTVREAYVADDGEYKLVLDKDGTPLTATFTHEGELIKILQ